uniref:E1 ubiquitin-activating enzyme n=1 Tax=Hemiselmis tepida TaxID=464990 RepID=A0A6T6VVW8_9CRYP
MVKLVHEAKKRTKMEEEVDEGLVKKFSRTAGAVLAPMCSIFGGIVGQEVAKAVSQKHHPVYQFVYLDTFEVLGEYEEASGDEYKGVGNRYDAQVAVLGRTLQGKMGDLKYFMVGCGALGCELFKNFAMMGVACGDKGMITVTDDDVIEKSNLSRQFLFRNFNVGQSKSVAATNAVKGMNGAIKIDARQDRVSPATESVYDDAFWEGLDGVVNALDNVKARQYVDQRCVFFGKSLLESGTMGTKCNVQCVIPHRTINYGGRKDPETKEAPECALHNFPHNINHCLSLGRSEFVGMFETQAGQASQYLEKGDAFVSEMSSKIWGEGGAVLPDGTGAAKETNEVLVGVMECLVEGKGLVRTMDECVAWARSKFEEYFSNKIKQLVFSCPHDMKNASGAPFWSPPKRFPSAIVFDAEDPVHMGFIIAAANLRAQVYNVSGYKPVRDASVFKAMLSKVKVGEFVPSRDAKIDTGEKKPEGEEDRMEVDEGSVVDQAKAALGKLPKVGSFGGLKMSPLSFEKDDDSNFHMDFISAFANLRARNYSIEEVDFLQAKLIAGRIIPALATTTSLVTGFVCLELIKLLQHGNKAAFKDLQCNLAMPMLMQIDPEGPPKNVARTVKTKPDPVNHPEYEEEEEVVTLPKDGFTVWDRIVVDKGDLTVQEFLDWWKSEHDVSCTAFAVKIGDAARPFYNQFMSGTKANLPLKMSDVYKKYDPAFTGKYFMPECSIQDSDMNEVETPHVVFKFK